MKLLLKDARAFVDGRVIRTDIAVKDSLILSVGEASPDFAPDRVIDCRDRFVIPALINAHTHAYMSLFRAAADDLPFDEWLFGRVMPMEDKLTADEAYFGSLLACAEMIKSGTGTYCDMHMFPHKCASAAVESGMRAVITRGLSGGDEIPGGERRINEAKSEMAAFKDESRVSFMVAPHSIYTCDGKYLHTCIDFADEYGLGLNIHLSESVTEVSNCVKQHGVSPVVYLDSMGAFGRNTVAAHCVHVDENDIAVLAARNVNVVANPRSNLKLGNGTAPVKAMLGAGINVCIGTDSASSNNSLSMIGEMNYTALLHKGTSGDASAVPAAQVLTMATANAAKAFSLSNGCIKAGMKADLTLLNTNTIGFTPDTDLTASLCYSADGREVDTVIVDGQILLEHGELKTLDEERIIYECKKIAERLVK